MLQQVAKQSFTIQYHYLFTSLKYIPYLCLVLCNTSYGSDNIHTNRSVLIPLSEIFHNLLLGDLFNNVFQYLDTQASGAFICACKQLNNKQKILLVERNNFINQYSHNIDLTGNQKQIFKPSIILSPYGNTFTCLMYNSIDSAEKNYSD